MPDGQGHTDPNRQKEGSFEIGMDEAWKANILQMFNAWFANIKRTFDEYQDLSLMDARDNHSYIEKVLFDAQQHDNARQNIANQSLQNAVETANMVSKQAVRHSDLAIDRQWNVDEVAQLVANAVVYKDVVAAAAATAAAAAAAAVAATVINKQA